MAQQDPPPTGDGTALLEQGQPSANERIGLPTSETGSPISETESPTGESWLQMPTTPKQTSGSSD